MVISVGLRLSIDWWLVSEDNLVDLPVRHQSFWVGKLLLTHCLNSFLASLMSISE